MFFFPHPTLTIKPQRFNLKVSQAAYSAWGSWMDQCFGSKERGLRSYALEVQHGTWSLFSERLGSCWKILLEKISKKCEALRFATGLMKKQIYYVLLYSRWWFQIILMFTTNLGEDFTVSDVLKPPTSCSLQLLFPHGQNSTSKTKCGSLSGFEQQTRWKGPPEGRRVFSPGFVDILWDGVPIVDGTWCGTW